MNQESVSAVLSKQVQADQKIHRELLLKQLSALRFLLRQGMAIRGHTEIEGNLIQLLLLRTEDVPQLKMWCEDKKYLSPEIQNEMISLMGLSVLPRLLADIKTAGFFFFRILLMKQVMLATRSNL